jgi:hypothetical protein
MDHQQHPDVLWGAAAGEPVPRVDPQDVEAVWELTQEVSKKYPDKQMAIGVTGFQARCKPGADIAAVTYRAGMVGILQRAMPAIMDPLIADKLDAVLLAAAEIPMEWLGVGIEHQGPPFDMDDFLRRVREAA